MRFETSLPIVPADALGARSRTGEGVGEVAADALFPLVYRHMRALLGGRGPDLDDLVQAAAEQALRSLPSFERRAQLSTWVYRVCYLTLLKHQRWYRRWLRRFRPTDDGEVPERATESATPAENAEQRERTERLRRALSALSPKRRAVLVLHDLEEMDVPAIAGIVGAKEGTVRSRLRDGRNDLAELLRADPYFGDAACSEEDP